MVKALTWQAPAPSFISKTHVKMLDTMAHFCNLVTGSVETDALGAVETDALLGSPANEPTLLGEFLASERPCLEQKRMDDT